MATLTETTPRSRTRLLPVLAATLVTVLLGIGFSLGWLVAHPTGAVTTEGDEFTAKVVAVKDDSICLARGGNVACGLPLYAEGVHPAAGDTVRAVELGAQDAAGTTTSAYYVLR